jgi:hypothetical protein
MDDVGRELGTAVRWVRALWDEPDLVGEAVEGIDGSCMTFLYEFDASGLVLRAIELLGKAAVPVGASSLAEFWEAQGYRRHAATPALLARERQYGGVPEGSEADWGEYPHDEIDQAEFERVWSLARNHLTVHPRDTHFQHPRGTERP